MKKKIVVYLYHGDLNRFIYVHNETIKHLQRKFKNNFFFLDVGPLVYKEYKKKKIKNEHYHLIETVTKLENFLSKNNVHCFLSLGKSFRYFKILRLLKKHRVSLYEDFSIGLLKQNKYFTSKNRFIVNFIKHKLKFIEFFIFRLFVLLNFLPKIDVCFEGNKQNIKIIKKQIGQKIQKKFNINIAYKRKILHINSRAYSSLSHNFHKLQEKYILFLDGGFDHPDVLTHSHNHTEKNRKKYYYYLEQNLLALQKIYKKKIIFSVHPKVSSKKISRYIDNRKIKILKYNTQKYILNAHTIVCHESSTVFDAILLKKRIIHLKGDVMGPFYKDRNNYYPSKIKIPSLELKNFKEITKKKIEIFFTNRYELYDNYIYNFVKNFNDYKEIFLKKKISLLKKNDNLSGGLQIAEFIDKC